MLVVYWVGGQFQFTGKTTKIFQFSFTFMRLQIGVKPTSLKAVLYHKITKSLALPVTTHFTATKHYFQIILYPRPASPVIV